MPALINTGDSALTKETMEAMFKTRTAAQATATPAPTPARAPHLSGKDKKRGKFEDNYIENNMPNGERSKRKYANSTCYCSYNGYDIDPGYHSGNCTNRLENYNEIAIIDNMLGGVTTNCFHHKG